MYKYVQYKIWTYADGLETGPRNGIYYKFLTGFKLIDIKSCVVSRPFPILHLGFSQHRWWCQIWFGMERTNQIGNRSKQLLAWVPILSILSSFEMFVALLSLSNILLLQNYSLHTGSVWSSKLVTTYINLYYIWLRIWTAECLSLLLKLY